MDLIKTIQRMGVWRLSLLSVVMSVLLSEAIVSVMGLLLKDEIPSDYLLTGLVASFIVASLIIAIVVYFLKNLSESQLHLQAIIEAEPECVKLLAADGALLQMNRAGLEMIEADSPEQVIGQRIHGIVLPKYRSAFIELTDRVFKGMSGNLEFEIRGLKGTHRWLETHAAPLRNQQGQISALLGITRDITERKQAEESLRQSETKLRTLYDSAIDSVILLNENGFFDCNKATLAILGCTTREEFCTKSLADLSPAEQPCGTPSLTLANQYIAEAIEKGSYRFEWMFKRNDTGLAFPAEILLSAMELDGKPILQAVVRDITERKKAENEVKGSQEKFLALFQNSPMGIFHSLPEGRLLTVNPAFATMLGYTSPKEMIAQISDVSTQIYCDPRLRSEIIAVMLQQEGWTYTEGDFRRKDGSEISVSIKVRKVLNTDGAIAYIEGFVEDITKRKAAEEEIKQLAFYDPLTGLPNRRMLVDRMHRALASSARTNREGALLFIDLDNFKTLNDTLGHDIGDLLLQQVAERLVRCVREGDTVARLGGDEFVLMLEDLSEFPQEAAFHTETAGEKILKSLNRPYQLAYHEYSSTPSIGVALFLGNQVSIDELMKRADIAMYQAKKAGRNTIRFFDPDMQAAVENRLLMENAMKQALPKRQFQLYYQMQVGSKGEIVGAEVLLRWLQPDRGMISPADFIPLAEETGLIVPIGMWVLESACDQLKIWGEGSGRQHLQLAVNVSARQFHQPDFVEMVVNVLQKTGIDPSRLKIELTESMVLDNITDAITKMQTLKNCGVKFSMDDFGTGHSSLSSLKKLPLNQLKIDQSFVRDIATDPDDAIIVQTIIAMANNLGMEVIAEGVETEEQRGFLTRHGCTHFQGYLFSRPVPLDEFEQLLIQAKLHLS